VLISRLAHLSIYLAGMPKNIVCHIVPHLVAQGIDH
jgi:hypothetical protein